MFRSQSTRPVVLGVSGDPVDAKLVQHLGHPGTNYTGMSYLASELVGKRIEFLKDAYPTSGALPSSRGRRRNPNSLPHPPRARQVDGPRTHRYGDGAAGIRTPSDECGTRNLASSVLESSDDQVRKASARRLPYGV